ncbi:MAG: hypothetical protein JWO37_2807 [Acidimicrobiales bacterium]|jgi:hypothetical protein|nr:hypothetical protein [Acidimicrobiales bacterium]
MTPPWARLQAAMAEARLDALLLASAAATAFALGETRRIGVHNGGLPSPAVVVPESGYPHVITPDADGAWGVLPPDRVHPMAFDPSMLARLLPPLLHGARRVGMDTCSPGGVAAVRAVLRTGAVALVDASPMLARAMAPKERREVTALQRACHAAHDLVAAGATSSPWFPLERFHPDRAGVEVDGWAGFARTGPGDEDAIVRTIARLGHGRLPRPTDGVAVWGVGRRREPAVAVEGAVLLVEHGRRGVTVCLTPDGPQLLSP